MPSPFCRFPFLFSTVPATTGIYTLSLHDALPILATLEPTFGAINLEDIKAPECFYIEEQLKRRMTIPVFHEDRKSTRLNSSHVEISYAVFCLKKKKMQLSPGHATTASW